MLRKLSAMANHCGHVKPGAQIAQVRSGKHAVLFLYTCGFSPSIPSYRRRPVFSVHLQVACRHAPGAVLMKHRQATMYDRFRLHQRQQSWSAGGCMHQTSCSNKRRKLTVHAEGSQVGSPVDLIDICMLELKVLLKNCMCLAVHTCTAS